MPGTRLVLGTWGIAGAHGSPDRPLGYGDVDAAAARDVLSAAWEAGIRWVDTAPGYGGGEGLRRLGAWQRSTGCRFEIVMKPGRPVRGGAPVSDLTVEGIENELAEGIALAGPPSAILLKDPPAESFDSGVVFRLLEGLEERDPDVVAGFASHDLAAAARVPRAPRPRVAQIELHGMNWRIALDAARRLDAAGWTVWAMQPLAYGFLAGRRASTFAAGDFRSRIPEPVQSGLESAAQAFLAALRRAAGASVASTCSAATLSLAFCLSLPVVERVVIGPKSVAQLRDALDAERLARDPAVAASLARFGAATAQPQPPRGE